MALRSRVSIGRQVAQALGYLHAKSISARCLSSRNVYLEPKVKLCVLDHGISDATRARYRHSFIVHTQRRRGIIFPSGGNGVDSRRQRAESGCRGRHLESLMSCRQSDSVNRCVGLLEEQSCQISPRSDLKRRSLRLFEERRKSSDME